MQHSLPRYLSSSSGRPIRDTWTFLASSAILNSDYHRPRSSRRHRHCNRYLIAGPANFVNVRRFYSPRSLLRSSPPTARCSSYPTRASRKRTFEPEDSMRCSPPSRTRTRSTSWINFQDPTRSS